MASEINVDKITPQTGTTLELGDSGDTITVTGTLDGSGLTGLNATNLTSGTVPDARFPATLPAASGANLTNLDASDLASGTIPDARFPATLPALNGSALTNLTSGNLTGALPAIDGSALTGISGGIFESQLLHVRDEKSSGTSGGTASTGYNTRALNTIKTNEITGASLSSNQITLPSGTYYVIASAPSRRSNNHRIRLRNTTDSSDTLLGSSTRSGNGDATTTASIMFGRFTISAQKVFEIQHYFEANGSGTDPNIQGSNVGSGQNEVYTDVQIWKVA